MKQLLTFILALLFVTTAFGQRRIAVMVDTNAALINPTNFFVANSNSINNVVVGGGGGGTTYTNLTEGAGSATTFGGPVTVQGTLSVNNETFTDSGADDLRLDSGFNPGTDSSFDLGTPSLYWRTGYLDSVVSPAFVGGGSGLTNLDGTKVTGVLTNNTTGNATTATTAGNITAGTVLNAVGGTAITNLNASQLTNGTVPLARLSGITTNELAGYIGTNELSAAAHAIYTGGSDNLGDHTATTNLDMATFYITNAGSMYVGALVGDGSGLTNLTSGGTNFNLLNVTNALTVGTISGDGSGLTNLFPRVFNVRDYGAGTAETGAANVTAIEAAVAAAWALGGGVVYVPGGTYDVNTSVDLTNNITLRGDGMDITILQQPAGTSAGVSILNVSAQTNVAILGLTLDGNQRTRALTVNDSENNGIQASTTDQIHIEGVKFYDVVKDGINFDGTGDHNARIVNNVFHSNGDAGVQSVGNYYIISGNTFTNCGWLRHATSVHVGGIGDVAGGRMVISDNIFGNCWQGIYKQSGLGCTINDNVFINTNSFTTNILVDGGSRYTINDNVFYRGQGINFRGATVGANVSGNLFNCTNGIVFAAGEHIQVSGNTFLNYNPSGSGSGVIINGATANRMHILNNVFHQGVSAVRIASGVGAVNVIGNMITAGNGATVLYCLGTGSGHRFIDNTVLSTGVDSLNLGTCTDVTVEGNNFANSLVIARSNNVVRANTIGDVSLSSATCISNLFLNNLIEGAIAESGANIEDQIWRGNTDETGAPLRDPTPLTFQDHTQGTHTGDLNETTIKSFTLPGGVLGQNGSMSIYVHYSGSGAGTKDVRIYLAGTDITSQPFTNTGTQQGILWRIMGCRNSDSSKVCWAQTTLDMPYAPTAGGIQTFSVDTTTNTLFEIKGTLADAAGTVAIESYRVEVNYAP